LQEHERRTGTKIDRNDPQAIILALRLQQQDGFNAERQNLSNEQERLREERDRLQTQLEQSTADAEADGVITPEEDNRIRQALSTQNAEVSGLATVNSSLSERIQHIAAENYHNAQNSTVGFSAEENDDDFFGGASMTAGLEGDATYNKGVANDFSL